jgi:hypothetical protein
MGFNSGFKGLKRKDRAEIKFLKSCEGYEKFSDKNE